MTAPADQVSPPAPQSAPPDVVERLLACAGFVLDLDGTLALGDALNHGLEPLPGAVEFTGWLNRRGVPYAVCTNGTTRTPDDYASAVRGMGFELDDELMVTPVTSAIDVLTRRGHRRVVALGGDGVRIPLQDAGLDLVEPVGRPQADAVFVGGYREFTMDVLEASCYAVWGGARLYTASQSPFFASRGGRALGTSRAITAMIRSVTGCPTEVVGKPSRHALRSAARRLGLPFRRLAVVGDDPDLEIAMARRGGALAIGVETGIANREAYDALPPRRAAHLVMTGVHDLLKALTDGR